MNDFLDCPECAAKSEDTENANFPLSEILGGKREDKPGFQCKHRTPNLVEGILRSETNWIAVKATVFLIHKEYKRLARLAYSIYSSVAIVSPVSHFLDIIRIL